MRTHEVEHRRAALRAVGSALGIALTACAGAAPSPHAGEEEEGEEAEVTPGEDRMQEHAVLERLLLVYDESARRIEASEAFDPKLLVTAAGIVRRFVEDYHEKQEEQFVFPRLVAARREEALVAVLRAQHDRGPAINDRVLALGTGAPTGEIVPTLRAFTRMYRPHASREGSVLFPAFREVVGRSGYAELGEQFEANEHALFGPHGFDDAVAAVAKIEAALGIADLGAFTPT